MDELAAADYELLPMEPYFDLKGQRQIDYISSVGCYFRCAFCADPFVYARRWTAVSPGRMGEEIETLWQRHRFTELAFQDETFFTYSERSGRDRRGAPATRSASSTGRPPSAPTRAPGSATTGFSHCVRSGLRRVLVGVESGSQEMLDWMRKDVTIEQVLETADLCVRHDVAAIFPFIVGFPGRKRGKRRCKTVALIKQLRATSPRFETPLFYFKPYPGSRITEEMMQAGYEPPSTLDEWARVRFHRLCGSMGEPGEVPAARTVQVL